MKASDARAMMIKEIDQELVVSWRAAIDNKIRCAAISGRSEITHPFSGIRSATPPKAVIEAIWRSLQKDGYVVTHHTDPDPGHPASGPYTSVSW